jgi:hypothetical protein
MQIPPESTADSVGRGACNWNDSIDPGFIRRKTTPLLVIRVVVFLAVFGSGIVLGSGVPIGYLYWRMVRLMRRFLSFLFFHTRSRAILVVPS